MLRGLRKAAARVTGVEEALDSIFGTQLDFTVLDCLEYYIKQ